jgi:GR25 family glycosyltransferase involved in LPS biosynthesis
MKTIEDITHSFYINLEHRLDRKIHVEEQLSSIGLKAERFNAIVMENGAIGCSMSHLKCLQIADKNKWDHVCICEDDITFLNPVLFKNQLQSFFEKHEKWDVVLFAGNNIPPYQPIDTTCVKVEKCQTTTGYLVNGHYIKKLMENIKMGLNHLLRDPAKHRLYAIDKFWFYLQKVDRWYLIIPLTVTQMTGYSDIEQKVTNYTKIMTSLDKEYLFLNKI